LLEVASFGDMFDETCYEDFYFYSCFYKMMLSNPTMPYFWVQVTLKLRLIHLELQVEMGPFKHEVDDGLDLRKAAFECMYTLLDTCIDRIDVFEFLSHVQDGLKDHYDIKVGNDIFAGCVK